MGDHKKDEWLCKIKPVTVFFIYDESLKKGIPEYNSLAIILKGIKNYQ